ncbi:MAG: CcmD family protein [Acidobacteriota bacterium]
MSTSVLALALTRDDWIGSDYALAAYVVIAVAYFGYLWLLRQRQARLEGRLTEVLRRLDDDVDGAS